MPVEQLDPFEPTNKNLVSFESPSGENTPRRHNTSRALNLSGIKKNVAARYKGDQTKKDDRFEKVQAKGDFSKTYDKKQLKFDEHDEFLEKMLRDAQKPRSKTKTKRMQSLHNALSLIDNGRKSPPN